MKEDEKKKFQDLISDWETDFTKRIKTHLKSTKRDFNYADALKYSRGLMTGFDKVFIRYLKFINSDPLKQNDLFKYVNAYQKGKKLHEKYFRHDLDLLKYYYDKADKNKKYNPFHVLQYRRYVLFMMLKFSNQYLPEHDEIFNITHKEGREYSPVTNCPTHIRAELPIEIKEYDISRAYPTFIFMELGIEPFDVYEKLSKTDFNRLLNTNKENKGATIEGVRQELTCIYGDRVNEVITEKRFNNKGQMFKDLTKYEKEYIEKFVEANNLETYVRLHDGVIVLPDVKCEILEFGDVVFKEKDFSRPEIINNAINFYDIDGDGKVKTSPVSYSRFFEQEGFIRVTREGHDQLTIFKNDNRIVIPFNHKTDLVPFLKANINEYNTIPVEDRTARDATNVIQQSLQLLTPIPLEYHRDTKERCEIPFKNGIARITADGKELIEYDEIGGFFAKHTTQKHEIEFCDPVAHTSDFANFLTMAVTNKDVTNIELTAKDRSDISAFCSMFGYLITNYKDPAFSPAIILSDEGADGENRNGGRGKSLLQKALSHFRPSIEKGGIAYDPKYTHVHADLKLEHDLYLIDDVPGNFDYNALYTHITGSIDAQRKGVTAETIPFEHAPKFVISTNWAVRYDAEATSTNRRFKEYKFSNFWNIHNTPDKAFGKSFFADWDSDEWNQFYNFGFYCVQHYLMNGLQSIEYDKKADNFRAYFYHDSILQEVERVFYLLDGNDFSVTEFVDYHQMKETFRYKPIFHIRNARKYIDAFIEFKKLPYKYELMTRKWRSMRNMCNGITDSITDKTDVMF